MPAQDTKEIIETLKQLLKRQKVSYRDLGERLKLSEGAIKNMFYRANLSLDEFSQICSVLGISMEDVLLYSHALHTPEFSFSEEQEEFFVHHPGHYNFFTSLLYQTRSVAQLKKRWGLSEESVQRYLRDLEGIGVLERYPNHGVKFKVYGHLRFREDGPWMRKNFRRCFVRILKAVLRINPSERHFSYGYISLPKQDYQSFLKELDELVNRYKSRSWRNFLFGDIRGEKPLSWIFLTAPKKIVAHKETIPEI